MTAMHVSIDPHPSAHVLLFETLFPAPLGTIESPAWLRDLLRLDAGAPLSPDEETRRMIRDVLRHGGYKPTGRGKPASEYLVRAAGEGTLTSINAAVDLCNVVSLHSGLPISLVDLDLAEAPLRIGIAHEDASYTFNASGQEIALGGLLCLHDARGPCANGVKDSQRTKTNDATRRTLSVVWGAAARAERTERTIGWYRELTERLGARTEIVESGETPTRRLPA
jgi:DNA/RNA-binding domain of Phe-tRNA-synthetase-like protein